MAKEQARRDAQQAELLLEARVAVFDTKKAEIVAQKILAQHSTMMKVALSELVVQTAEDLRSGEVKPKDRTLAMVALKTVCDRLFGWDREPDIQRMERARTSDQTQVKSYYQYWLEGTTSPTVTGAVNLALIATTPEQLQAMAEAEENRDGQGAAPAQRDGFSLGPSPVAPEQPRAAAHGCPIPEKEALPLSVKPPVQPRWDTDLQQAEKANRGNPPSPIGPKAGPEAPQNALKHSVQQTSVQVPPPPLSPQERRRMELEELARLRAEWRGWR